MRAPDDQPAPSQIEVAVYVHRIWVAEQARAKAYAELAAVKAAARADGLSLRAIKAAMGALKRGRVEGISAEAQAVLAAVEAVPIGDVEVLLEGGALLKKSDDERLAATTSEAA